ncbi:nickel ABC transporter permease subunit NikC [Thermodesulfovibrionales bacterium]|nr:nickel ABC transporter permease subunit NikC [Thermodesulfovibrionales bacterium]MCL0068359.1 nickel ABC transporter permease subunit NikC [Thermodesulfovibrionales bacterium]MCL0086946.1 nickel ABC transporter permease subunit NikC [Thermodesulfovibrionales bacterium]
MHDMVTKIIESRLPSAEVFQRLKKHRLALIGAGIILVLIFIAVLAPFIAPHDPIEQNLEHRLLSPNTEYLLGTDNLGRCILSRLIHGTSVSLQIGVMVVGIAAFVGVTLGLVAGYRGGLIDELIMRIVDILLAFPGIILALVIAGILGPSLFNVMLALAVVGWTSYARVVRGAVLSVKEKEFVEAAQALGAGEARIMFRHILPNVMAPVIVMATLGMAHVILAAAALGFLGLGAQPPTPEWGSMLNDGRAFMRTAPHLTIFPGLAIMVTVLAFNFLGDGLRDALDPRLKGMMR